MVTKRSGGSKVFQASELHSGSGEASVSYLKNWSL